MRRGPRVVGAIFAAVAILSVLFLVMPKMSAVEKARADLATAQQHQQELELRLAELKQDQQQAPQVEQRLAELKREVPPTEDAPGLIRMVADAAASSSVDVSSLTPGAPIVDGSGSFSVVPVAVSVQGSFFALDEFIFRLEQLPRAMKVTSVTVTVASPPFELSIALNVEVYTTDVSSGAAA